MVKIVAVVPDEPRPHGTSEDTSVACTSEEKEELKKLLEKYAIDKEVLAALVSGGAYNSMLSKFLDSIKRVDVKNFFMICMDDQSFALMNKKEIPCWNVRPKISSKWNNPGTWRFQLVREVNRLGYHVLISDVDVVFFKNPFKHLHRDKDVETMSDGVRDENASGKFENVDVFSPNNMHSYPVAWRIFHLNCGFTYYRAAPGTIAFLDRLVSRIHHEEAWDQSTFTEELLKPAYGDFSPSPVTVRVMELKDFPNSREFLFNVNYLYDHTPVMLHANCHQWQFKEYIIDSALKRYNGQKPVQPVQAFPVPTSRRLLRLDVGRDA